MKLLASVNRRYPITFRLIDTMIEEGFPDKDEELTKYLIKCGLRDKVNKDDILYFNSRIESMLSEVTNPELGEEEDRRYIPSSEYGFGDSFNEFLKEMGSDEICLYLCDYDFSKALQIYCTMDREDVLWSVSEKIKLETHKAKLLLESCVFGFGGKMGKSRDEGEVTDLTEAGSQGFNSLFSAR